MPWSYVNGTFVYSAAAPPTVVAAPIGFVAKEVSGEPSLGLGDWVEHTDTPSALTSSFLHFNIVKAHTHVQAAQENSVRVAGIVSGVSANTYDVASSGTAMAWVLEPIKTKLPLSGVYSRSINGIASGQVVILYNERDHSFTMASTRDSDLEFLRLRFDALTNT